MTSPGLSGAIANIWLEEINRNDFFERYQPYILTWLVSRREQIICSYYSYSYHGKSFEEAKNERDRIEKIIKESRELNKGGIDLSTVDKICLWGFNRTFPLRDQEGVIEITRRAFSAIDREDLYKGIRYLLLNVKGVGISRASKVVGLSDQNRLAIYDSRVGNALKGLTFQGSKIVPCPPGRVTTRDCDATTADGWARGYERLIWILEIIKNYLNEGQDMNWRIADVEMALFMLGK